MRLFEELRKLDEVTDGALIPAGKGEVAVIDMSDELNAKLLKKIKIIADALKVAFEKEGIDLDAQLIADDITRDCGLMGGIVDTDELDVEGNPFDAATKQMHDMGPIDTGKACQMLLAVEPHEFVSVFMNGLKRNHGLLPGGPAAIPHKGAPRRIGEGKEKDYSYIIELVNKYAPAIEECKENLEEEVLNEKITDLKGFFKNRLKQKFDELKLTEKDFMKLADLDPTHEQGSNGGGSYIEWLTRLITKGVVTFEQMMANAHEYTDQLKIFEDQKKRNRIPGDKKDIMRYKTLEELMDMLQELGAGANDDEGGHSDFKQDVKNIRDALVRIVGVQDRDIPADIQKTEDVFKFIGSNDAWDVIVPKNPWGAAILDRWGAGAGWCVGGMLGNNRGMEQIRQAENYFSHYNQGGAQYVCFQRKDRNASRPDNKFLITLGPNGTAPATSAGYQFNDANNRTQRLGDDWGNDGQMDAFLDFLQRNNLIDIIKNSEFKDCECFLNLENLQRLEAGEPYRYAGGKIRELFRDRIQEIIFTGIDGKEYKVSAIEHPEFLQCESLEDMTNMNNIFLGEPYIFTGEKIKPLFKPIIKTVVFAKDYDTRVRMNRGDQRVELLGIPENSFRDCVNLEEVNMPVEIVAIGFHAFVNCEKAVIKTPRHRMSCFPQDVEYLKSHVVYTDEPAQQQPKEETPKGEE